MNKEARYEALTASFKEILQTNLPRFVHLNNLCALLKSEFNFYWVGFYLKDGNANQLLLGPYQGPLPCFTIAFGKGVCGTAALSQKVQIVPDVHQYPGYIACHPEPNSEIVIPGILGTTCVFVLDIDHIERGYFDKTDEKHLVELCQLVVRQLYEF